MSRNHQAKLKNSIRKKADNYLLAKTKTEYDRMAVANKQKGIIGVFQSLIFK